MTDPAAVTAFWVLAVLSVVAGIGVVTSRNLFHSAVYLVAVLLCVAALYLVLAADFLFGVQVLVYAGAIAVLIIFAVMLTQQVQSGNSENFEWIPALFLAIVLFGTMAVVLAGAAFPVQQASPPAGPTTDIIASALFGPFVLPFEIASAVLLVAMIGAIVLAREERG